MQDTLKTGRLTIQFDELWSFVDNKGNKQWVWLALDANTREIVGVYIGARDEAAARKLWESLPPLYRQCAIAYTDCRPSLNAFKLESGLERGAKRRSQACEPEFNSGSQA
ncbi:MAG: hypothetical protein GVY04_06310 [Cyanobacteria bacterium]|jgi:IS1 family transposase|nr:hypothetical protein [Cyanobacteria bacterium GSL.Bin1]